MHPLGFNRIQPRTLAGQVKDEQATTAFAFDPLIVLLDPLVHPLTGMPRRIVPDQDQCTFAARRLLRGDPLQILTRHLTDRSLGDETEQHLVFVRQIESITGERLALGIVFSNDLLDQSQRVPLAPRVQGGLRKATPPDFVAKA